MAELAAAEEKHKRLLKRLKHGGHDTKNLENKFKLNLEKELLRKTSEENLNESAATGNHISEQKMKQIFNLLREDTVGLPAEITEEQLKMILAKVSGNSGNNTGYDTKHFCDNSRFRVDKHEFCLNVESYP